MLILPVGGVLDRELLIHPALGLPPHASADRRSDVEFAHAGGQAQSRHPMPA
jgi:hypothetical protein